VAAAVLAIAAATGACSFAGGGGVGAPIASLKNIGNSPLPAQTP
jgi:hypothetical protein